MSSANDQTHWCCCCKRDRDNETTTLMNRKSSGRCRPKSGQSVKIQQHHPQQLQKEPHTEPMPVQDGTNYDPASSDEDEGVIQNLVDECERVRRISRM